MQALEMIHPEFTSAVRAMNEAEKEAEKKLGKELEKKLEILEINRDLVIAHRRKEAKKNHWRGNLPKKTKMKRW
jgi:hypothetical protein